MGRTFLSASRGVKRQTGMSAPLWAVDCLSGEEAASHRLFRPIEGDETLPQPSAIVPRRNSLQPHHILRRRNRGLCCGHFRLTAEFVAECRTELLVGARDAELVATPHLCSVFRSASFETKLISHSSEATPEFCSYLHCKYCDNNSRGFVPMHKPSPLCTFRLPLRHN